MKFLEPRWLMGLIVLPIFYLLIFLDEDRRKKRFARFADPALWKFLSPELNFRLRFRKSMISLMAFLFGILALARPQWGSHEEVVKVSGLDVILVLDVSNSMFTEDVVPSRLQKMKHWVRNLLPTLEGDRVGVVAFAASTAVVCPLTSDLAYVWDTVQLLDPKMMKNQGTDIGLALQTATQAMERGAEEVVAHSQAPVASRVVLLVSDGEDHEKEALAEADRLKERGIKFFVFGVGTDKGGPIPIRDDLGNTQGFKRDRKGEPIVSVFQSGYLAALASRGGGKYWSTTAEETEIKQLMSDLGGLVRGDYSERRFLVYEDRFQIPLFIAVVLIIFEISIPVRNLLSLFLPILLWVNLGTAQADGTFRGPIPLESYLETQRGIRAYSQGNLEEAQRSFGSAQALDPSRPELEFNQGVLQFRQGELDRAIESFKNSAQLAEKTNQQVLQGKSLYNLGNAYSKKGEGREAIRAYSDAVQSAIQTQDTRLEQEARKNLQLVLDQLKKREQTKKDQEKQPKPDQQNQPDQKQNDQKQNEQKSSDQKKQDQKQSSQKDQKGEDQKQKEDAGQKEKGQNESRQGAEGDKKYQQTEPWKKKDDFKSQKMTSEDADRVLSELKSRERELQEKLQKKNGNQQNQAKDW
jgi:Ca-activated chloride channel family protein